MARLSTRRTVSDIIQDYQTGLAGTMLEQGVVRLAHASDDEGHLRVEYEDQIMGEPGSALFDMAVLGYARVLRESGLMHVGDRLPMILAFTGIRPLLTRVIREAYGRDWAKTIGALPIPDPHSPNSEEQPVVMFDTTLNEQSVYFAQAAKRHGRVIGAIALLDLQRGSRTALNNAGIDQVHSVITLQQILRFAIRSDTQPITQRQCIEILGALDPNETHA